MTGLVELTPGAWVRADQVTAIIAFAGQACGSATIPPQVKVHARGCVGIGWEFKTWEEATAFAAKLAKAVNHQEKEIE